jgi:serine/threonine protein phosphatase 1
MIAVQTGHWQPAPVAAERPLVAIGDVHGRDDLLAALLGHLTDAVLPRLDDPLLVFLGDFLGKGPDGIAALRRAANFQAQGAESLLLPGNHEQMALAAFAHDDPAARVEAWHLWALDAGRPVLAEIGLSPDTRADAGARALARAVGPEMAKMMGRPVARRVGNWFLVHSAALPDCLSRVLEPALPPPDPESHPLWAKAWHKASIFPLPPGTAVLHGHVPCAATEILPWRINIDTKAWRNGMLTAVEIDSARMRLHQAVGPAFAPKVLETPTMETSPSDG